MPMSEEQRDQLRASNAFNDTIDFLGQIDRDVMEADFVQMEDHGIDLDAAALFYLRSYDGGNLFVKNVRTAYEKGKSLSRAQKGQILNNLRRERFGLSARPTKFKGLEHGYPCYVCEEVLPTFDALMDHKANGHGSTAHQARIAEIEERKQASKKELGFKGGEQDVIATTVATKGLDLSALPDGRYAAGDTTGKNDHVFLMVKRVRYTKVRDRRYRYGKIVTGNEVVLAGTIEVRIWSSDSKELIGQQKPGDVYRGEREEELELVLMMPEPLAKLFGRLLGYCCICGKPLTDEESRAIGMGLECEKKQAYFKDPKWRKSYGVHCPCCTGNPPPKFVGLHEVNKVSTYECNCGAKLKVHQKPDFVDGKHVVPGRTYVTEYPPGVMPS